MKKYLFFAGLFLLALLPMKAQDTVIIRNVNLDSIGKSWENRAKDLAQIDTKRHRGVNIEGHRPDATSTRVEKKTFSGISDITVTNQFGNVTVKESSGKQVELEIRYFDVDGKPQAACTVSTSGSQLSISTNDANNGDHNNNQGSIPNIDYVLAVPKNISLTVNLKFGNLTTGNMQKLTANTSFSTVKIDYVEQANITDKFSNYTIGDAKYLTGDFKYSTILIQNVQSKLTIGIDYSHIELRNTSSKIDKVSIKGSYSDMKLSFPTDLSATLDAHVRFGNIEIDKKYTVKYSNESSSNFAKTKNGQIGSGKPTATINLSNLYANIDIE